MRQSFVGLLAAGLTVCALGNTAQAELGVFYRLTGSFAPLDTSGGTSVGIYTEHAVFGAQGAGTTGGETLTSESPDFTFEQLRPEFFSDPSDPFAVKLTDLRSFSLFGFLIEEVDDGISTVTPVRRLFVAADPGSLDGVTLDQFLAPIIDSRPDPKPTVSDILQAVTDGADLPGPGPNELFLAIRSYFESEASETDFLRGQILTKFQPGDVQTVYAFDLDGGQAMVAGEIAVKAVPEPVAFGLVVPAAMLLARRRQ